MLNARKVFRKAGFAAGLLSLGGLAGTAWGIQTRLIQPKMEESRDLRREIRHVENNIRGILAGFPDLTAPQAGLKKQEGKLVRLRRKAAAWNDKVLSISALRALLAGETLPPEERSFNWDSDVAEEREEESSPPYFRENFHVNAVASYPALVSYLNSLEKASPFTEIVSLNLSPDEGGSTPRLKAEIVTRSVHSEPAGGRWQEMQALPAARP